MYRFGSPGAASQVDCRFIGSLCLSAPARTSVRALLQNVLPQFVRADVGGIDRALGVRHDARRAGDAVHVRLGQVGIGYEVLDRAVLGAAHRDAPGVAGVDGRIRMRIAHVQRVVFRDKHRARPAELLPCGDEATVLVEDLHAAVAAVGDVHAVLRTADGDVVRLVELARPRPVVAPVLMNLPSFENFTTRSFLPCPSVTKMSPLGATAMPVGWSKVSGPLPLTPFLPSVIRTLPVGLILKT